ncbi:MAG: hypothetical protein PF486_09335 [Prolixibacteraceae bacterium]|jgi:hypothetical protein|nr:hypothetical protein [Prolixibacteraceae bacterium]
MKKALLIITLICVIAQVPAQTLDVSHWRGSVSYQNSFHNSYRIYSLGVEYRPINAFTVGLEGGLNGSEFMTQYSWGVNASVYPLEFVDIKDLRFKPYVKCSYLWQYYTIEKLSYEVSYDVDLPIRRHFNGWGGFFGLDFKLFNNIFLFGEVGFNEHKNYSAGIKINIDGWEK